jgi:formate dehydrogenase subunit delta
MSGKSTGDRLVYMANQISMFFDSQPGDGAALHIAEHIAAFWTPGMRRELTAMIGDGHAEPLRPAAVEAMRILQTQSDKSVERQLEANGGRAVGHEQGSDAG